MKINRNRRNWNWLIYYFLKVPLETDGLMIYQIDLNVEELFFDEQESLTVRFREEGERIVEEVETSLQISVHNEYWSNSSSEPSCHTSNESLNTSTSSRKNLHNRDLRNRLKRIRDQSYPVIFESFVY